MPVHSKTGRKTILVGSTLLLAIVIVELICRIYEWTLPGPQVVQQQHAVTYNYPPREFRPYTIVYNKPNIRSAGLSTNSAGFRGMRELSARKNPNCRRIFFLGGSTAVGFDASSDLVTIPSQVEGLLRAAFPKLEIEVYNAACSAFNSTQELVLLVLEILDDEPDLVILLDGRNDLYFSTLPQWTPHYTTDIDPVSYAIKTVLDESPQPLPFFQDLWEFSRRHSAAVRVYSKAGAMVSHVRPSLTMNDTVEKKKGVFHSEAVRCYVRNIEKMAQLCHARKVPLVAILQPSLVVSRKQKTPQEQNALEAIPRNPQYPEDFNGLMQRLYPEVQKQLGHLNWPADTYFLDASDLFVNCSGSMFKDEVHFSDEGNHFMAAYIVDFLRAKPNLLAGVSQ